MDIVGTPSPPPLCKRWGVEFSKFAKKGGLDFSHKKGGVGKIGGYFKKRRVSLIFILTSTFQYYPSLSVWCVYFVFLHHFYQHYLYFTEQPSLIAPNQQIWL